MGPPPSSNGVFVRMYTFMNTFLWYFFQTLTLSSMLLMVLAIYYYAFASSSTNNNIQVIVVCIISVAFAILSHIFIKPNLPQIASMAIPILGLNRKCGIRIMNISVWMICGYVYPFPVHLSCYSLMMGVGLLKMYGDGGRGSLKFMDMIIVDATPPCFFVFNLEMKHGTGRWVDSGAGWALLGMIVVSILAYFLPPLVEPKKKKMVNVTEAA